MKKKFRVWATYQSDCYLDIEAEDKDEAYAIAKNTDGGDFTPNDDIDNDSWEIKEYDIEEIDDEPCPDCGDIGDCYHRY